MKEPKNFLVFLTNSGVGKTHFLSALTAWLFEHFDTFRYWKEEDLHIALRASMSGDIKGDYLGFLKLLIDDQHVIIDDIGCEGVNEWRDGVLFKAIDERYNSMLPTILISNFSKNDFNKLYKPRISSRLFAKENIIIEMMNGEDLRAHGL